MKEKNSNNLLFLAVEEGGRKCKNHANAISNTKMKMLSRKWLREKYLLLAILNTKDMKMSAIEEEIDCSKKCSNNLKEFLSLTFKNVLNNKQKKIRKQLRTCAQALGMQ